MATCLRRVRELPFVEQVGLARHSQPADPPRGPRGARGARQRLVPAWDIHRPRDLTDRRPAPAQPRRLRDLRHRCDGSSHRPGHRHAGGGRAVLRASPRPAAKRRAARNRLVGFDLVEVNPRPRPEPASRRFSGRPDHGGSRWLRSDQRRPMSRCAEQVSRRRQRVHVAQPCEQALGCPGADRAPMAQAMNLRGDLILGQRPSRRAAGEAVEALKRRPSLVFDGDMRALRVALRLLAACWPSAP